jgi:hypothetical protein
MKWLKEKGHKIYRSQGKFNISQGNFSILFLYLNTVTVTAGTFEP